MALFTYFELKEFNSASLTGSFQNFGTPLSRPAYAVHINNSSGVDAYVSIDGTNNSIRVPANSDYDLKANDAFYNKYTEGSILFKAGTQLQIKQVTAGGTGTFVFNILTVGNE